jgi:tRNA pseudouridine38-40 synthase
MHNIKLTVSYDGSDFHGWQIQPAEPTIQGTLVQVAEKLTQERIVFFGAGRTDAGVHALGQVANFRTHSELTPRDFHRAFNALLPPAIRVIAAEEAGPDFHARFQSIGKTYQYRIYRGRVLPPFERQYVLHDPYPLDVPAMAQAAKLFEGEHDFSSFAASAGTEQGDRDRSPVRQILSSRIFTRHVGAFHGEGFVAPSSADCFGTEATAGADASASACAPDELVYVVRGKSFLRYMVRKIVGTLLDVGRGKLTPEDIPRLFELRDRSKSGPTVPPQGLYLVAVEYPEASWKW